MIYTALELIVVHTPLEYDCTLPVFVTFAAEGEGFAASLFFSFVNSAGVSCVSTTRPIAFSPYFDIVTSLSNSSLTLL